MMKFGQAGAAIALAALGLAAAAVPSQAAGVPYSGVGQHQTVMGNIYRAQQRNNAAISHVQNNIRSTQHRAY